MKNDHFLVLLAVWVFFPVFRQVKKCLILQLNEMIIVLTTCSCVPSCFYFVLWSIFIGWSARTYEKQSFFSIFSCFGLFTLVFEQVNEWPILEFYEMIRVLRIVAFPIVFILFYDDFLNIFVSFGLFPHVFWQVNEWPISKLHEIIRVLNAVACPIIFVLFDDPYWQGRVLKIMKNDHFLVFLAGRSAQTYEKCSFL